MRRQDRTAGKKKKEKAANRLALMGITLVVLSLAVTVHLSGISMEEKDLQYRLKEEQLEKQKSESSGPRNWKSTGSTFRQKNTLRKLPRKSWDW